MPKMVPDQVLSQAPKPKSLKIICLLAAFLRCVTGLSEPGQKAEQNNSNLLCDQLVAKSFLLQAKPNPHLAIGKLFSPRRANDPPRLIVPIGIPGSGKTFLTSAASFFGWKVANPDLIRVEILNKMSLSGQLLRLRDGRLVRVDSTLPDHVFSLPPRLVFGRVKELFDEALKDRRDFVLDGMNIDANRVDYFDQAMRRGYKITAVVFNPADITVHSANIRHRASLGGLDLVTSDLQGADEKRQDILARLKMIMQQRGIPTVVPFGDNAFHSQNRDTVHEVVEMNVGTYEFDINNIRPQIDGEDVFRDENLITKDLYAGFEMDFDKSDNLKAFFANYFDLSFSAKRKVILPLFSTDEWRELKKIKPRLAIRDLILKTLPTSGSMIQPVGLSYSASPLGSYAINLVIKSTTVASLRDQVFRKLGYDNSLASRAQNNALYPVVVAYSGSEFSNPSPNFTYDDIFYIFPR